MAKNPASSGGFKVAEFRSHWTLKKTDPCTVTKMREF